MSLSYDVYTEKKKYCTVCGCIMLPTHDGDICECCLDELYDSDPGEDIEE